MTGHDSFGEDTRAVLNSLNVDTSGMRYCDNQHTTLAFVSLAPNGERTFSFCRNPGADTQIKPTDLDIDMLENARILHIGSLSLTDISYDPNYRANLWHGRSDAIPLMKSIFPMADSVKVSDEELELLFGKGISHEDGAQQILSLGPSLVLITLGSKGVYYATKKGFCGQLSVPKVKVADTTGAGDNGGILYRLTRREKPLDFTKEEIEKDISFANAVASLCVTKRGAIPALPTLAETEVFMTEHGM